MTNGAAAGGAAAAGAAAAVNAVKAIGPVVLVERGEFLAILRKTDRPLVVHSPSGFLTKYKYLTNYRGLYFACKAKEPLMLPASAEIVSARKISLPDL